MGVVHVRRVRLYGSVFMATQAALRDVVRIDRLLLGGHETLAAFVAASPRLALTSIALAVLGGLLAPAYAIATGALVQAVSNQQPATWPLIALAAIFTVQRTLDPIREEIGLALWPRVDERLNDRIMSAVSRPAGLQELESPAVLIEHDEPILAALVRAAARDLPEALPSGLATQLGRDFEGGVDLSLGQWQKVALGRAMMRSRILLLLLDEPTASLDAPTEHALFEHFALAARDYAHAAGAITVLVSHRFSTVRMADLILVVDNGRIVERGTHAALLKQGGLYAELYGLQASAYR